MHYTFGEFRETVENALKKFGFEEINIRYIFAQGDLMQDPTEWTGENEVLPDNGLFYCRGDVIHGETDESEYLDFDFHVYPILDTDAYNSYAERVLYAEIEYALPDDMKKPMDLLLIQLEGNCSQFVFPDKRTNIVFLQYGLATIVTETTLEQFGIDDKGTAVGGSYDLVENKLLSRNALPEWSKYVPVRAAFFSNPFNKHLDLPKKESAYWGENIYYDKDFPRNILVRFLDQWVWMDHDSFVEADFEQYRAELALINALQ